MPSGYYSSLMSRPHEFIDPWKAADREEVFEAEIPVSGLSRVVPVLVDQRASVRYRLRFHRDLKRRACVQGEVNAQVRVACQRCLQPLAIKVDAVMSLALVQGLDEAELLPEEYDPLLVDGGRVRLLDLVEDEILLALPQVPKHADGEPCVDVGRLNEQGVAPEADDAVPEAEADNPFAVLAQLKERLH